MQDQVNEKTAALSIKATKLTGRLLAKAMKAFLEKSKQPGKPKIGKQSIKSLTKGGASLSNIEITSDNIATFKKTARKYNVDFSLQKDSSETPPKWLVFFKAKYADALTAAFKEYSKTALKTKSKPSFTATLNKFKELAKTLNPVKRRERGEIEH